MAVAVLRSLEGEPLPQDLPPGTGLLVASARSEWAAASVSGGALVLALRPAAEPEAQPALLCAALQEETEADFSGRPELWLSRAALRQLGLTAGRRVRVWPVRRPPVLGWVLLGAVAGRTPTSRAGSGPASAVLVRRGESLPGSGLLVLEARPTLQGLLGAGTRLAVTELRRGSSGEKKEPPPPPPPLVSGWARPGERWVRAKRSPPAPGDTGGAQAESLWVSRGCLHSLGLFQGEWVSVSRESEEEQDGSPGGGPHLATVRTLEPQWDFPPRDTGSRRAAASSSEETFLREKALVPPALAFNLSCDPLEGSLLKIQVGESQQEEIGAAGAQQ